MPDAYPRVLVVNFFAFNQSGGGPITMSNLFYGWPLENISVVHRDINGNDPHYGKDFVVSHELALPGLKSGITWETQLERNRTKHSDDITDGRPFPKPALLRVLARKAIYALGITPFLERFPLSMDLCEFIDKFKPDVIYTHLDSMPFARLVLEISDKYKLPIVVHMMDDYPATIYRTGLFASLARRALRCQLKKIFYRAAECMSICQAMSDEYRVRYGRDFTPFHNPVDLSVWSRYRSNLSIREGQVKIVYSGRVGMAMSRSINDVCDVVRSWADTDLSPFFEIYVNDLDEAMQLAPFLKDRFANIAVKQAPADLEGIAKILSEADILLLPIDFDHESVAYIRFSMPTKVPAYMATGKPILVYGPAEVATIRYASDGGWGYVVSRQSPQALREGIRRMALDHELRVKLTERAKSLASENHDALKVSSRFQSAIINSINNK